MKLETHWQTVFETKASTAVSWYQHHLVVSLGMITRTGVGKDCNLLDVGGGDSTLVDDLVQRGFSGVTVLDIASSAIERAKLRLGEAGGRVSWKQGDILLTPLPDHTFDVWHDRAVFHFLVEEQRRREYVSKASNAIRSHGHLIIATFASDGPELCSGLPTMRYSQSGLTQEFNEHFTLIESQIESHLTPQGREQRFIYCRFRRE
jgi:ubiquinone/menaquinone biosynthesis C-methylase UbiE